MTSTSEPPTEPAVTPEPVSPVPETPILVPEIDFVNPPNVVQTEVRKEFGGTPVGPTGPTGPAGPTEEDA